MASRSNRKTRMSSSKQEVKETAPVQQEVLHANPEAQAPSGVVVWSMVVEPYVLMKPRQRYGDKKGEHKDRSTQHHLNDIFEIRHGRNVIPEHIWEWAQDHPVVAKMTDIGSLTVARSNGRALAQMKAMQEGKNPISKTEHFMLYDGASAKPIEQRIANQKGVAAYDPSTSTITGGI